MRTTTALAGLLYFTAAAQAGSLWDQNGSLVSLDAEGTARRFVYEVPHSGLP